MIEILLSYFKSFNKRKSLHVRKNWNEFDIWEIRQ